MKGFLCVHSIEQYYKEDANFFTFYTNTIMWFNGGLQVEYERLSQDIPDFENNTYGPSEPQLYSMLIKNARLTYESNTTTLGSINFPTFFENIFYSFY